MIAKYYEKEINDFITVNNVELSIVTYDSLKKIINADNLFVINSCYPGYSFNTKDGYLLSEYYDYSSAEKLEEVIDFLKKKILNNIMTIQFPEQSKI